MACLVIALAATFLSGHYGGPQLLYALLIGLAFHFLISKPRVKLGVDFCGRSLLRVGVALLGARITLAQVAKLGVGSAIIMLASIGAFTPAMTQLAGDTSRWLLVMAIAAAGIKTSFEDILELGWQPVAMLVGETLFIASFVLLAILVLRLGA